MRPDWKHMNIRDYDTWSDNRETWRSCVEKTSKLMGFAVSSLFDRYSFDKESKQLTNSVINAVKYAFKNGSYSAEWMDDDSRFATIDNIDTMTHVIGRYTSFRNFSIALCTKLKYFHTGYNDFVINPGELDMYYSDLKIETNEYLMNIFRANQFSFRKRLIQINTSTSSTSSLY